MQLNKISCILLAHHCVLKWRKWQVVMKTSFIRNILITQLILIKFALHLLVRKCQAFQLHLLFNVRLP